MRSCREPSARLTRAAELSFEPRCCCTCASRLLLLCFAPGVIRVCSRKHCSRLITRAHTTTQYSYFSCTERLVNATRSHIVEQYGSTDSVRLSNAPLRFSKCALRSFVRSFVQMLLHRTGANSQRIRSELEATRLDLRLHCIALQYSGHSTIRSVERSALERHLTHKTLAALH